MPLFHCACPDHALTISKASAPGSTRSTLCSPQGPTGTYFSRCGRLLIHLSPFLPVRILIIYEPGPFTHRSAMSKNYWKESILYPIQSSLNRMGYPSRVGLSGSMLPVLTGYCRLLPVGVARRAAKEEVPGHQEESVGLTPDQLCVPSCP